MTAVMLTDLADLLRHAGLEVVEIKGWKSRGRPGSFDPKGVLAHHTGGKSDSLAYAEWMALVGRPDEDPPLRPPLAQLGLDRKGVWYVLAAGRANHAGRCKPIAGLQPYPGRDYGDGNAQMVGVEAMNTGSEGWTDEQYASYVRGVAAINAHYGWSIVLGHKETSLSGKPDPGGMDMDDFRRDVRAINPEEDDMPTPAELFSADIIPAPVKNTSNPTWSLNTYVPATYRNAKAAFDNSVKTLTQLAGLEAVIGKMLDLLQAQAAGFELPSKAEMLAQVRDAADARMALLNFDDEETPS